MEPMKIFSLTVVALFLLFIFASPVSASAASKAGLKHGNLFYFFDKVFEKADLFFTFNSEKKTEKALEYADERLAEAEESANENDLEAVAAAMENYQENVSLAKREVRAIKDETKTEKLLLIIASSTSSHQEVLEKVLEKVPKEAKEAIQKAIEVSKKEEGEEEATKQESEKNNELKKNKDEKTKKGDVGDNKKNEQKKEAKEIKEKQGISQLALKKTSLSTQNPQEKEKPKLEIVNSDLNLPNNDLTQAEELAKKLAEEKIKKEQEEAKIKAEQEQLSESQRLVEQKVAEERQEELKKQAELEQRLAKEHEANQRKAEEELLKKEVEQKQVELEILTSPLSGNIIRNSKLVFKNSPYVIIGTMQVLEIEPGVVVKFNKGTSLNVGGTLLARGTSNSNIIFTSNNATPQHGDWGGINFVDEATDYETDANGNYLKGCIIENSIVEYAEKGIYARYSSQYISDNIIRYNKEDGIYLHYTGSLLKNNIISNQKTGIRFTNHDVLGDREFVILHNDITNNSEEGIYGEQNTNALISLNNINNNKKGITIRGTYTTPTIETNNFQNKSSYNIYMSSANYKNVEAFNNWWDANETQFIADKIWDYQDDISLGKISYEPFAVSKIMEAGIQ